MEIQIYSIRRSGQHAIIFWLIENFGGWNERNVTFTYFNRKNKLFYYNDCSSVKYDYIEDYNVIIKNHEDVNVGENGIVIVRDFLNLLASRMKNNNFNNISLKDLIILWKSHVKCMKNNFTIIYNKWLVDKKYRDEICEHFGIVNKDVTNYVPDIGG